MVFSPDGSSSSCTFSESYCCEGEEDEYRACIEMDEEEEKEEEKIEEDEEEEKKGEKIEEDEEFSMNGEYSLGKYSLKYGSGSRPRSTEYGEELPDLRGEDSVSAAYEAACEEDTGIIFPNITEELPQKQSIFTHSSSTQFPDITRANKSVFGSIFVKVPVTKCPASGSYRKTGVSGQFSMIPAFLDYVDKEAFSGDSRKRSTLKGSIFRAFEKRGIAKEVSTSSGSQWDVYPITKSALFSFQINDRIHQTRNLSKIEERITSAPVQVLKFAHTWPSGSTWTGHWDGLGMAGAGTYIMPHEVCYIGKMQDGMCHDDDATLIYPNGFKVLHCNFVNGELTDYQFEFPDSLAHEEQNWEYCQYPDRRFWSEVQNGLKPAKSAQKTQKDPARKIPQDYYDTNDGFFNPKTKILCGTQGELLRVPTAGEEIWIKSKCRKGFNEFTRFRPEYYENWYDNDNELIQNISDMQRKYFEGIVTYEELYQFYADNNILPSCSPFKKNKHSSDEVMEKVIENCPLPKKLVYRLEKRYQGHRIPPRETSLGPPRETSLGPPRKPNKWAKRSEAKKSGKTPSLEKLSWKIKFSEGNKTSTASTGSSSTEERDSKFILKKSQQQEHAKKESYNAFATNSLESLSLNAESNASDFGRRMAKEMMKGIIMEIVLGIVLEERERHRNRLARIQSIGNLSFGPRNEKEACLRVLEQLYSSIPDKDEFCDSVPGYACDLKKLAEDRFQTVKYWGKRIFTLSFDEKR